MPITRLICITWLGLATLSAEEGVFQFFDSRPTAPGLSWRTGAQVMMLGEADAADGAGSVAVTRSAAQAQWLAWRQRQQAGGDDGPADEWWIGARATHTILAGDLHLPSGAAVAGDYLDLGASATWRHPIAGGGLLGASLAATAEGQALADTGLDLSGQATVFGRVPMGTEGRDGLLLALNYDPDRMIFGNLPVLPLLAWQGVRGPWILVLGVPFSVVTWRGASARVTAVVGPLPSLGGDLRLAGPLHLTGEARWSVMQLRRAERVQEDDRVRASQWEWSGGLALVYGPMARVDLVGGIATARRLGEDEDATQARREGVRLAPAPFAGLRCRVTF